MKGAAPKRTRAATSRKKTIAKAKSPAKPRRAARKVQARRQGSADKSLPAWLRVIKVVGIRVAAAAFVGTTVMVITLYAFGRDLPSVDNLADARRIPRIMVADRYGLPLGVHGKDRGAPVDIATLPPHVLQAFLATEDRTFFHHVGVNPLAIIRAMTVNLHEGELAQGGSTITQQLVKNLLLTSEKTYERKIQEMLLALRIEAQYTKEEILGFYLNAVYFGNNAYGLESAARRYFGKKPQEMTIGEAAMLAGVLKAPTRFSPVRDQQTARGRATVVLMLMVDAGFITRVEATEIIKSGMPTIVEKDHRAGYAVSYAVDQAEKLLDGFEGDVIIRTTIDKTALYRTIDARKKVAAKDPLYKDDVQTAAIAMEADGAIRVLIGGNDFARYEFNRAIHARRQPGSVFKPFVYLAALEQGWRPEDKIEDSPVVIGSYKPKNYKEVYAGAVSLTEAMSRSLNAAAIRLQEDVGRDIVVSVARRAGFSGVVDIGPALALGVMEATPLEIAGAFLPFANDGVASDPYIVVGIETLAGKQLYTRLTPAPEAPVFARDTLVAFDHMLRHVVESGSGHRARVPGHYAAGKTGTSQGSRDAWFAGYASGMVGVIWLGKDNDSPMENGRRYISGSGAPASLWAEMMVASLGNRPATMPTLYHPRPKSLPKTMYDHLVNILTLGSDEAEPAPTKDGLADILADIAL